MSKKSLVIWFLGLSCEVLIYWNKFTPLNKWYVDNIIKLYFVYTVIITLVYFLCTIVIAVVSSRTESHTLEVTTSQKFVDASHLFKKRYYKPLMFLSLAIDFGYGVIGCWWFFSVTMVKQTCTLIMINLIKQVIDKIKRAHPELIKEEIPQKKKDPKLKFKFLKKL